MSRPYGYKNGPEGTSLLNGLWERQIGTCCYRNAQISCRLLRIGILQPRSKFTLTWEKQSQKHVCIGLDRRVYFDNHHLCYYNDGFGGAPHLRYTLKDKGFKNDQLHKIWGVLLYHCHMLQTPKSLEEKEVCLLVLTADGFLKILNADSGNILRSIFLSTAIKFRYLAWANYLYTVQVKSILATKPPLRLGASAANNRLMTIALFRVHPLELQTCFPIEKHIFGEDVTDASVSEDILEVRHRGGTVKMYSVPWIIQNCTVLSASLGKYVELNERNLGAGLRAGAVGNPGFGIPCTVKLKECPPLIFSAKTSGTGISFGGCPTMYLHNPYNRQNEFHLESLRNRELISVLKTDTVAFHPDIAEFHFDDHRRVLHISGCSLRQEYSQGSHELVKEYNVDFRDLIRDRSHQNQQVMTSSGRLIRRPSTITVDCTDLYASAVQDVDYENETDLLYAVVTLPDSSTKYSDPIIRCNLYFIDEKSGKILKTVPLPTWEPDGNNSIYYELDCIFHLLHHHSSSTSTCYYYRLSS